jgi:lipopolysaccharide transport system permease protein
MSASTELVERQQLTDLPIRTIEASHGWTSLGFRDIWEYRELLYLLVWREIQGAYRQTALGMSWIFLRPVISVLILSLVFGRFVKVPTDGIPYPLFSLTAMLPWTLFSNGVLRSSRSLVDNMHIISKVYFPRLVVPVAGVMSGLVDFGASLVVLVIAMILYRLPLRAELLWLPFFTLVTLATALCLGLWLATLSVKYRDVSFAINFLLQTIMFLSPVIYPVSAVPESLRTLYELNPMTGVITGFRWAILGTSPPPWNLFAISCAIVAVGLIIGAYVFRRTERNIVDLL